MNWKLMAMPLAICLVTGSAAFAVRLRDEDEKEPAIQVSELPAPARAALERLAGRSKIEKVDAETEEGVTVYEATWTVEGVEHEASVDAAGSLLETEHAVREADLPQAVRDAVATLGGQAEETSFEVKTLTLYSVERVVDGTEHEVLLDPAGRRIELEADEHHDADDDGDREEDDDEDEDDEDDEHGE